MADVHHCEHQLPAKSFGLAGIFKKTTWFSPFCSLDPHHEKTREHADDDKKQRAREEHPLHVEPLLRVGLVHVLRPRQADSCAHRSPGA